ncbi:MAG TPA: M1 family aminopeptidase [Bryobacteraceae bacterium]|nr:M1 family aminopeptidase [Bryobacteraceae bacterium]
MRWLAVLILLLPASLAAWDGPASELAGQIREAGLDPDECYRVRDLSFTREDLRFYFTDGYLIFGKPVDGRRRAAVFAAEEDAGDAEVLVFPPTRSERMSLAKSANSPNLNEHFRQAVMLFSDDTYEVIFKQIQEAAEVAKSPEMGVLLEQNWNGVVRNLASSFETRIVGDALSGRGADEGFFFSTVTGDRLGNFDLMYDPQRSEQIAIGRVALRGSTSYFDIWTSFEARSFRNRSRSLPAQDFRLANYRLDATLEPGLNLKVSTRVTVTPAQTGIRVLAFSFSPHMRVTSATIGGQPAECFQRDALRESLLRGGDATLLLLPPLSLERGKPYEVEFRHEGKVIHSAGNNVYYVGSRDNWYPNLLSEFSTYDVFFRYPKELDLVVAGEVVEEGILGDSAYTHRRITTPVRLLGFNLGTYERLGVTRGPYTFNVYANRFIEPGLRATVKPTYSVVPQLVIDPATRRRTVVSVATEMPGRPADPASQLKGLAAEVASAFEFFAGRFGPPPLRELTVSPIPAGFGQGFPGLVYLPTVAYLRPEERPAALASEYQQFFYSDILHAHEVAHQWWGNTVGTDRPQDFWLMEAMANYSALLYLERRKGAKALDSVLEGYRKRLVSPAADGRARESIGPIIWGPRLHSSQAPDAWQAIVYEKGSWIIHMLRRRLGEEKFLAFLSDLTKRYSRQALTTEQFRALAAKYVPPGTPDASLDVFFDNWVYATGIPTVQMESSIRGKGAAYTVTGKLTQSGVDADFTAWFPVEIQFRAGKPVVHWVKTDSEPVTFSVALKQQPLKVVLDPSGSVLALRK